MKWGKKKLHCRKKWLFTSSMDDFTAVKRSSPVDKVLPSRKLPRFLFEVL
jgi:hypothetical protein